MLFSFAMKASAATSAGSMRAGSRSRHSRSAAAASDLTAMWTLGWIAGDGQYAYRASFQEPFEDWFRSSHATARFETSGASAAARSHRVLVAPTAGASHQTTSSNPTDA